MKTPVNSIQRQELEKAMQGMWWLLSRIDRTKEGQQVTEPVLGSDPVAILCYANGYFSAQFMKRQRTGIHTAHMSNTGANNTNAVGGYDAYFGNYVIDEETGLVTHILLGSITPANVGMTVHRDLSVTDNTLTIRLDTTTGEGEPVTRTLTWKRIS